MSAGKVNVDYATAARLAETYGEAFYLYDEAALARNFREFLGAFAGVYRRARLAYSYKTNYMPALCRRMEEWGAYAEVVSIFEYELARRLGVAAGNIIFNGPLKSEADLGRSLRAGAIVNLDSFYELPLVEKIAGQHPDTRMSVGVRCSFDVGSEKLSRFGFDVGGGDFAEVLERLRRLPNVDVRGLHCHFLPPGRSTEGYAGIARRMIALAGEHFPDGPPGFIDVGGGFFSRMSPAMRGQFSDDMPDFADYGEAVARPFAEAFPGDTGPELIIEPGLALVADVMQFVCKVLDIKQSGQHESALVSGSVYNVRPTKSPRNLSVQRLNSPGTSSRRSSGPLDIVGYTCMEDDILHRGFDGEIAAGDFLVFENVGAYTLVLKPPFILPAPPVIAVDEKHGVLGVVRRPETLDDVFACYSMEGLPVPTDG